MLSLLQGIVCVTHIVQVCKILKYAILNTVLCNKYFKLRNFTVKIVLYFDEIFSITGQ